jgi:hypothetical protein
MLCFTHNTVPAIAVCKSCGKALCGTCVKDLGFALVCSESCAGDARDNRELVQRAKRLYGMGSAKKSVPPLALVFILFAVFFGGFGIFQSLQDQIIAWYQFGGAGLMGACALLYYRAMRIRG